MLNLSPGTMLQRVPEIRLQIDSSNLIQVVTPEGTLDCGPHALLVLDAFYQPRPLAEALSKLQTQVVGTQDWINLTSTVAQLYQAGILRDESQIAPTLKADTSGYDAAPIHVRMLNDRTRTASFLAGIREVVRPGDVVVDIGTGTGIFAMAAAQAGARHVYAVEASGIGRLAQAAFEANGLADRITLIQGWSTQIELPERADVLTSEMVGNDPMSDYVLEVMADARKRLLKPGARLVPRNVRVLGLPVAIPRAELTKHTFTTEAVDNWREWYGIDFEPFAQVSVRSQHVFSVKPYDACDWPVISDPVLIEDIDLMAVEQLMVDRSVVAVAKTSDTLSGLLIYFEVDLGLTTRLSLHPSHAEKDSFRYSPVWVLGEPLEMRAGEHFVVTYRYRVPGSDARVSVARADAEQPM
jgi:predicted O-methyltransferase YrrM